MASLKHKTVSGVKWEVVSKVSQKVISVASFAILARILEPAAFGLFALAFVAIDGLNLVRSFGLDSALIHRKESIEEASDTTFFLILASGTLIFLACQVAAPLFAHFFRNPEVTQVIRALGFIFLLNSVWKVPSTLLSKQMEYRKIAVVSLCGAVANCGLAILFALVSPTVWSLVWAYVIKQVVITVVSWKMSGYRLRGRFSFKIAKELLHFGKFMLGLSFLWYVAANLDNIVIGKMLGTVMLGYFAIANNVANFINTHFTSLVGGVMFPAYSRIQDDPEALERAYFKTVKFVSMLSIPFSIGLIFLADEFVFTLYGAKWAPVIPLVQLFGFVQLIVPIKACSSPVFMGKGRPDYSFKLTLLGLLLKMPLAIFFIKQVGLMGVVISELAVMVLLTPLNLGLVKKLVRFKYSQLFSQLMPSFLAGLSMIVGILATQKLLALTWPASEHLFVARFLILGSIGVLVYLIAFYLLDRKSTLEVRDLALNWKAAEIS